MVVWWCGGVDNMGMPLDWVCPTVFFKREQTRRVKVKGREGKLQEASTAAVTGFAR